MIFWRDTARVCGALVAVMSISVAAQAQTLERALAGIRLNTSSQSILKRFGSPTQIVVGEVGYRLPGGTAVAVPPAGAAPTGAEGGGDPSMMGLPPVEGGAAPMAGVGPFGNTQSTLAKSQEVTWVYDRGAISYEFLIGPEGRVLQVKAIGRGNGPNVSTQRGIRLGSTFAAVVRAYGYGEEFQQVGPILVASYKNKWHVSFQFMDERVIAITVSSVE